MQSEAAEKLVKYTLALFDYLKRIRQPYEDTWQDIADHVAPIHEDLKLSLPEGQRQGTKIYDGSPLNAVQTFSNGMYGYLVSNSILWFRHTLNISTHILAQKYNRGRMQRGPSSPYISRYETLEDVPEVRAWLQEESIALYRSFQRTKSFYSCMPPFFQDGGTIGTATIYSEEDIGGKRVVYRNMHPGQVWIAENRFGDIDTVFVLEKLTAKKAAEQFGREKLSDSVKAALENEPFKPFSFLHAVYPREVWNPAKIGFMDKPFADIWIDLGAQELMQQGGHNSLPFHVWRYWKSPMETYGRSPGMYALYDIMALNKMGKAMLGAAKLSVEPPYNVPSELLGHVDITPSGFNYYGDDHNRIVSPVHTGINYPIGTDREERKQRIIEKHFFMDFFMMLAQAQRQLTATEVMERSAEKAVLLGGVGNFTDKTLDPMLDRQFEIEYRAGRLPEIPSIMVEYGGEHFENDFLGPLAQAQKRLFRTQGITQGLAALQPLASIYPEVLDIVNPNEAGQEVLEAYNFPQRAIRTPEEIDALRKARAQLQEMEQKKADLAMATEQAKTLAEADQASGGKIGDLIAQGAGGEGGMQMPAGNA